LKQNNNIQRVIAFFLLVVFSISMAPKTYFHTVLANHKDVSFCNEVHKASSCLHKQSVQCHFDDLVVNTPFFVQEEKLAVNPAIHFDTFYSSYLSFYTNATAPLRDGRGPPCV